MPDTLISSHAYVGPGVTVGRNVRIGPGAVILGPCLIGDDVWVGPGAQIGAPPEISDSRQNASWTEDTDHSGVMIRAGAVIREGAIIHQGSRKATIVGENTWVLNRAYIAHDVTIGSDCTISGGASIGGHCVIESNVTIGMNATVHQRRRIGVGSIVGMGTPVTYDLPPYAKAYGSPMRVQGVNAIGMARLGLEEVDIKALESFYAEGDLSRIPDVNSQLPLTLRSQILRWQALPDLKPPRQE